jgi:hypothetical protein
MITFQPRSSILLVVACLLAVSGLGCQKMSDMKHAAEQASKALEEAQQATSSKEAGQKMGTAFEKLREAVGGGKAVQAVDFRTLKTVLPASVPGLKQEDVRGERGSQMGFSTSKVDGIYAGSGEQRQRLTITITDLGSMSGIGAIKDQLDAWGSTERESSRGYERSATIAGYDGTETFQTYDRGGSRGHLEFLVASRFQVQIEGRNVPMETMKAAAERIDTAALESMKDAGVGVDDGAGERIAEMYEEYHRAEQQRAESGTAPAGRGAARPESVAATDLHALLPAQAADLPRTDAQRRSNTLGEALTVAMAEATYADRDRRLTVTLTDYAEATAANGIVPGAAWLMFDVNKESDTGYERTTTLAGHPAKETLRRHGATTRCQVDVIVGGRFAVGIDARNVPMAEVKAVIDQIGLARLESLASPSV